MIVQKYQLSEILTDCFL